MTNLTDWPDAETLHIQGKNSKLFNATIKSIFLEEPTNIGKGKCF